jgi:hypothetical protein
MTQDKIDAVERQFCTFFDDSGDLQWARLITDLGFRDAETGKHAIVDYRGETVLVAGLMSSFPLPSVNLIPGAVLDEWTAGIEAEIKAILSQD